MAYARAVWFESNKAGTTQEYERTVPSNWIIGKFVYWPNHLNVRRSFLNCEDPHSTWKKMKLKKVKVRGEQETCDAYDITSCDESNREFQSSRLQEKNNESNLILPNLPNSLKQQKKISSTPKVSKRSNDVPTQTKVAAKRRKEEKENVIQKSKDVDVSIDDLDQSVEDCNENNDCDENYENSFEASSTVSNSTVNSTTNSTVFEILHNTLPGASKSINTAASIGQRVSNTSNDKLQTIILRKLAEMQLTLNNIVERISKIEEGSKKSKEKCSVQLDTHDTVEEITAFDNTLKNNNTAAAMVKELAKVGGKNIRSFVRNILNRLMTHGLQAKYNLAGKKGKAIEKLPFQDLKLYRVIIAAVQKSQPDQSDEQIRGHIGECLKQAPDRVNGGGRKKDDVTSKSDDENQGDEEEEEEGNDESTDEESESDDEIVNT